MLTFPNVTFDVVIGEETTTRRKKKKSDCLTRVGEMSRGIRMRWREDTKKRKKKKTTAQKQQTVKIPFRHECDGSEWGGPGPGPDPNPGPGPGPLRPKPQPRPWPGPGPSHHCPSVTQTHMDLTSLSTGQWLRPGRPQPLSTGDTSVPSGDQNCFGPGLGFKQGRPSPVRPGPTFRPAQPQMGRNQKITTG